MSDHYHSTPPVKTIMAEVSLCQAFNAKSGKDPDPRPFAECLEDHFGAETARGVMDVFKKMGIPPPETPGQYLDGMEGPLTFMNRYGLVLRIEHPKSLHSEEKGERVANNPYIVPKLAEITVGAGAQTAVVTLCPGGHFETDDKEADNKKASKSYKVENKLAHLGIAFRDRGVRNLSRMPKYRSARNPDGVLFVIDPLAVGVMTDEELRRPVEDLTRKTGVVKSMLGLIGNLAGVDKEAARARREAEIAREFREEVEEIMQAREQMYGPLQDCFAEAWNGKRPMKDFWELCKDKVRDGDLVAGWNEYRAPRGYQEEADARFEKTYKAQAVARNYEAVLSREEIGAPTLRQKKNDAASAAP